MKSDLDRLMNEKGMDGILVFGNGDHNPSMVYLTGGGHFTTALLIKKQGVPPVLIVNSMEREEAARTGLQVETFDFELLLKLNKANPNQEAKCSALFYQHYLEKYGMTSGRVGLYGTIEIRREWAIPRSFPLWEHGPFCSARAGRRPRSATLRQRRARAETPERSLPPDSAVDRA
ncbi:MAG: hypothetical protein HGA28_05915 [Anaerolineaceae bacterium]|nr:hypothetical protein [Anaerolineaceae bacterium]